MSERARVDRRMPTIWPLAILKAMLNAVRTLPAVSRSDAAARPRIRLMGLRRALAALEAGERANDRLHQWTITPRGTPLQSIRVGT